MGLYHTELYFTTYHTAHITVHTALHHTELYFSTLYNIKYALVPFGPIAMTAATTMATDFPHPRWRADHSLLSPHYVNSLTCG